MAVSKPPEKAACLRAYPNMASRWALALFLLLPLLAGAETTPPFVYADKAGVQFTVTADGLTAITLAGRTVAKGNWHAVNADWINKAPGKVNIGKILDKSMTVLDNHSVLVRQRYPDAEVTFRYTFAGEDVTIKAKVENTHPTESIQVIGFQGLQLSWQTPPQGMLPCMHGSWLVAHPGQFFHPSMDNKIGGTYGADATLGVGASPLNATLLPTITMWDYADWTPVNANKNSREFCPRRNLQYFVAQTIEPESARTFGFQIRVSANTDWRHLLQPYKEYFTTLLGPVRYQADPRPIIQMCANKSVQYITPQNPYGYHDGWMRLDQKEGVQQFCDQLIPLLKSVNGQGVIIWGQQGSEPRGAEYRPDFDVLPPETEANWVTLQARFHDAGLKLGVATRPDSMPIRLDWKSDGLVNLNPDDPGQMEMLWARFKHMIDKGCTLFYMDCFGMRIEDVKIARFLREKMGPNILTFSEMSCDAILPYTGLYLEVGFHGDDVKDPENAGNIAWLSAQQWEIMRWLVPGISTAARPHIADKDSKTGNYYRWMLERRMTPLEQPWQTQAGALPLKALLPVYFDEKGQWKKND